VGIIGFLNKEQKIEIGYSYVMENAHTLTPYGHERLRHIKHFTRKNISQLTQELDEMELVISSMKSHAQEFKLLENSLHLFKDIRGSLKRCKNGNILDEVELYEIKSFTRLIQEIIKLYKATELVLPSVAFEPMDELLTLLDPEKTGVSTFYIYDSYSQNLSSIRIKKRSIEAAMLNSDSEDELEELRKQRLELVIQEEAEELKIRTTLSDQIRENIISLEKNTDSLGRLDFLMAKCRCAISLDAVRPSIGTPDELYIKDGFNPQVADLLRDCGKSFTPISIRLKSGMTVITGANMGGKSVTLKTVVLNLMLLHTGFFVCAKEACLPVLDFIELISDDLQSISQGLSTFGAEIMKLREMLVLAKKGIGFMGFDEFARGTNPNEGCYMAKALCMYLNKLPSISLLTTHYDGVADSTMTHYQVIGLENVNFEKLKEEINLKYGNSIDIIQSHMDYRLKKVTSNTKVPRDALNISMLMGLDEEIIAIAKNLYEKGDCSNYGK